MKAWTYPADGSGKATEGRGARRSWSRRRAPPGATQLIEMVAEADDALMEQFLRGRDADAGRTAGRPAHRRCCTGKVAPLLCASGLA